MRTKHSRIHFWPGELEPDTQKPPLELVGQPWARGKPTDEECKLFANDQEGCSKMLGDTHRIGGKAVFEVIPYRIHSRLNRGFKEPSDLCAVCANG